MADAAAELDEGGIQRTLKDLFAGAAGGVAQVLLGQLSVVVFIGYFAALHWMIGAFLFHLLPQYQDILPQIAVFPASILFAEDKKRS